MSLPIYMCDFHLYGIRSIMMARTLTYRHHTSPRDRSLEYLRTFLSALKPRRIAFSSRTGDAINRYRSNAYPILEFIPHTCRTRLLKSARGRISRVKARPGYESSSQHAGGGCFSPSLFLSHCERYSSFYFFFHACYSHYTNWPVFRTEANHGTRAACVVTSGHTLPITCDSQLRIN